MKHVFSVRFVSLILMSVFAVGSMTFAENAEANLGQKIKQRLQERKQRRQEYRQQRAEFRADKQRCIANGGKRSDCRKQARAENKEFIDKRRKRVRNTVIGAAALGGAGAVVGSQIGN